MQTTLCPQLSQQIPCDPAGTRPHVDRDKKFQPYEAVSFAGPACRLWLPSTNGDCLMVDIGQCYTTTLL